jgi:signal-transduction protein with cAMP-binding, CBS, and nucleotidyltransferase domain
MTDEASFLARVSIFSFLAEKDLERIAALTNRLVFGRGDFIIREGDGDRRLFIIVNGEVEVIKDFGGKKERCVRTLGPCSYFGEMSLIDDLVRSASVRAKEDTQVLYLDRWDLRREIEKNPTLAFDLLQMLSRRIRTIEKTTVIALGTFLPTCANCKSIREASGSWTPIEEYITDRSETEFSHGICPKCAKELYPEYAEKLFPGYYNND